MTARDESATAPMERVAMALGARTTDHNDHPDAPESTDGRATCSDVDDDGLLSARDVALTIGDQRALDGVDLAVDPGEIVVLLGPNGAGKSMFLSACSGALEPDAGRIRYAGGRSPREARGLFSVAVQGEVADPDLTGAENCRFYQRLHPAGTDEWRDLAERLELGADLDRTVDGYSGGMTRKVELASALAADVPLFLLDEPAAALDLSMLRVLHDELLARREAGASALLTSHTPLDAQIADRLVFLREGGVVADGPPDALLEALPPVLRVRGAVPDDGRFLGDRAFGRGDEVRGFLESEADAEAIAADLPESALVDVDPPSFTDLFNYYAYLADGDGVANADTQTAASADAAAAGPPPAGSASPSEPGVNPNDEEPGGAVPDQ